jgi:hypothetical protein
MVPAQRQHYRPLVFRPWEGRAPAEHEDRVMFGPDEAARPAGDVPALAEHEA